MSSKEVDIVTTCIATSLPNTSISNYVSWQEPYSPIGVTRPWYNNTTTGVDTYSSTSYTVTFPAIPNNLWNSDRSKKLSPKFHCIYCGTQDFDGESKHTPHCPNCGALMRIGEE